jgi:hypothetical protein
VLTGQVEEHADVVVGEAPDARSRRRACDTVDSWASIAAARSDTHISPTSNKA